MIPNPMDVAVAMAQQAHALGLIHYQETGALPTDLDIPVWVFGGLPETPILACSAIVYNVDVELDGFGTDLQSSNPLVRVQVRFRTPGADLRDIETVSHAFYRAMHSQTPGTWPGGVAPLWCLRTVTTTPELDNGAWSKADSYEIRYNPGAH